MKVLYILSSSSTFGGSTKSFLRMLFELQKREMEIHVVCPDRGPAYEILQQRGIQTFVIPTRFHTYPQWNNWQNRFLFLPRLIKHYVVNHRAYGRICTLCEQYHYDVIHTNVSVINVGERVARRYGITHVYHIREYQDLDFGMYMIPNRAKYVSYLQQCHSICITKGIQQHYGLSEQNSTVIYNGIKSEKDILYNAQKEDYFLFVGRIDPNKGFDVVLRAFADYRTKDTRIKLLVAGMFISSDFEHDVRTYITEHQLTDAIEFLGLRNDVDSLMQKARACVIASPNEAFGLVMVEAMFNGCLTIALDACGTREQLENAQSLGLSDIALPFQTEKELSDLMLQVATHSKGDCEVIIRSSQTAVASLYTVEQNAAAIYAYYQKLLCRQ